MLVLLTAALSACGDGDDDTGTAGRTTSTTTPSTQTSVRCGNVGESAAYECTNDDRRVTFHRT